MAITSQTVRDELGKIKASIAAIERELGESFGPGSLVRWVSDKTLVPMLQALARAESNWNPKAVSSAGAQGLMQLMPRIQEHFGVTDPFDPEQSVVAAEKLFKEELNRFKDPKLAIAAYNAGSPRVYRAIKTAESTQWEKIEPHLPEETRKYVPKVLRFYDEYVYQSRA